MTVSDQAILLVARPARTASSGSDGAVADDVIEHSVIIPALNEAFRLPVALDALRQHVDRATTEIIVVDDGSDDATSEVAKHSGAWAKHLVVIRHQTNMGKGASVRAGVAAARGDAIAFIDADNATDLAALAPMRAALGPNVQAVFGSRHAPGSKVTGAPAIRGVMGRMFNQLVQAAAGTNISDTQCGAKVFSGPAARMAFADATVDGFAFDVEILRRLLAMRLGIVEYPVDWHYVPGTKVRLTTPLKMLRDIGRIRATRTTVTPLYIDVVYRDSFAPMVDPLHQGQAPVAGQRCRIVLPNPDADAAIALLDQAANATPKRARAWSALVDCR